MGYVSVILQFKCFSKRIWRIEILGTCCEIGLKWMPQNPGGGTHYILGNG